MSISKTNWKEGVVESYREQATDEKIAELAEKFAGMTCETPAQYKETSKAIAVIRELRVSVEKKRKELKADSLAWGRAVDSEAKRITALLQAVEEPLKAEKKKVDDEKARIKAEAERKKREEEERRLAVIREEEERVEAERKKLEEEKRAFEDKQKEVAKVEAVKVEVAKEVVEKMKEEIVKPQLTQIEEANQLLLQAWPQLENNDTCKAFQEYAKKYGLKFDRKVV